MQTLTQMFVLTIGRHEETSVDFFGVTEVWLNLLPTGIELPLMDAAGFDVQHIETDLSVTMGKEQPNQRAVSVNICLCFRFICIKSKL